MQYGPSGHVRPSLLVSARAFLNVMPSLHQKVPDHVVTDFNPALGQLRCQVTQFQVRRVADSGQQPARRVFKNRGPPAVHRLVVAPPVAWERCDHFTTVLTRLTPRARTSPILARAPGPTVAAEGNKKSLSPDRGKELHLEQLV